MLEALNHIDQHWLLWVNGYNSPGFDKLMYAVSGRFEWIPLYAVLLGFIIRKYRWKSLWIILAAVILIVVTDQVANLLKYSVRRPRPCKDPAIGYLVHLVNNYCGGAYGFVSGHAANSAALAAFISLLFRNKWVTSGMVLWSVVVSYSRIYLGAHYPGDVIAGAATGIAIAFGVYAILRRYLFRDST